MRTLEYITQDYRLTIFLIFVMLSFVVTLLQRLFSGGKDDDNSDSPTEKKEAKRLIVRIIISIVTAAMITISAILVNIASSVIMPRIEEQISTVEANRGGGSAEGNGVEEDPVSVPVFDPTAEVVGWNNEGEPREFYTLDEINSPDFVDKMEFNSISDSVIGHEANFVAAREDTGINAGADNVWSANEIEVQDGKEYLVRLYAHNNGLGIQDTARDVKIQFIVPDISAKSIAIHGVIYCSNAIHKWYSDGVKFVADQSFHLEYIPGSTLFENNGIGSRGGVILSDDIVKNGTYIGFNALDGNLPGCYKYSCYTTMTVKVAYD